MGVSVLRNAACAGVLVGALMLGGCAAGLAFADPGGAGHSSTDEQSSKGVNNDRLGLAQVIKRILGEHRKRVRSEGHAPPKVKVGSDPVIGVTASEPAMATLADVNEEPGPEVAPDVQRDADSGGTDGGVAPDGVQTDGVDGGGTVPGGAVADGAAEPSGTSSDDNGSDYLDNAQVAAQPTAQANGIAPYRYPLYWWQLRAGGGDWWNVDQMVSSFQQVISPLLPSALRQPEPQPTPTIGPAFRGGAPEPDPVLDASGGVTGGGSDYQATGFGGSPVLTAPIVAVPAPPPAAARFPAFPPAGAPAPGVGSAVARVVTAEPGSTAQLTRATVPQQQGPESTVKSMSGQTPRLGYTEFLRRPGLPQLAGAALPGVAGILLMTLAGGIVGYRQASAGRMIRASGAARYLP